jgi:hypothetical protein
MSANERQIGGDHYKKGGEEHWDRQWRLYGRGYFVGCITKYVERYHEKNGLQDLQKAQHFLEKLIELEIREISEPSTGYDTQTLAGRHQLYDGYYQYPPHGE